jgi:hypothetical protein
MRFKKFMKPWKMVLHLLNICTIVSETSLAFITLFKRPTTAKYRWLMPVILATQEAEIRSMAVLSQSKQIVHDTLSRKYPTQKRAGGVIQRECSEFNAQYH